MKPTHPLKAGFTLTEVMIVVLITGILAAMLVPSVSKARERTVIRICQDNLRLLNNSAQQYLFANPVAAGSELDPVDLQDYFFEQRIPTCPAKGVYSIYTDPSVIPTCSIGKDAGHWIDFGQD